MFITGIVALTSLTVATSTAGGLGVIVEISMTPILRGAAQILRVSWEDVRLSLSAAKQGHLRYQLAKPSVVITDCSIEPRTAASLHKSAPPMVNMQIPTWSLYAHQAQLLASPESCPLTLLQGFPLGWPLAPGQCCCE